MTPEIFIVGLAFFGGFMLVFGLNLVVTDIRKSEVREERRQLLDQLRDEQKELARESPLISGDLGDLAADAFEETMAGRTSLPDRLQVMLHQAGMHTRPEKLITMMAGLTIGLGSLTGAISGSVVASLVVGLLFGAIPLLVVEVKRQKRLEEMRAQLPDAFDLMARILRAGQTMAQGMQSVAHEFKPPIAVEFGYCYEQQNLGLNPELALRDLAHRTGLLEIKIFVLSLLVHRQTGGNLAELLEKLATIVRDRYRLRGKVKAITAEGRMQGVILMMLPIGVYIMMFLVNRPYAIKLFDHPWLPITTVTMMGLGGYWIRRIVNFDF